MCWPGRDREIRIEHRRFGGIGESKRPKEASAVRSLNTKKEGRKGGLVRFCGSSVVKLELFYEPGLEGSQDPLRAPPGPTSMTCRLLLYLLTDRYSMPPSPYHVLGGNDFKATDEGLHRDDRCGS